MAIAVTKNLRAELVVTDAQVQQLRQVRNSAAGTFSHDNFQISELAQRAWWVVNKSRVHAWLYFDAGEQLVGYGLVRLGHDGFWWNSIAVVPECRGHGYGSFITSDVLKRHPGTVWSQVRPDNYPGLAMHHVSEWEPVDGPDTNLVLLRSKT